jgi:hypothetical protein
MLSLHVSITDLITSFILSFLFPVISTYFSINSLNVLTYLSINPNLLPFDICSSFDTLVSNLILLSSQKY